MSLTLIEVLRKATRKVAILLLHGLGLGKKVDILFESINLNSKEIYTYETHIHDLMGLSHFNSSIEVKGSSIVNDPKTTIVMQGPIDHKSDFTKKTVLHYLNTYKSTNLILSTWEHENIDVFAGVLENPMFESRFTIIQSQKPEYVGINNINLQIVSTQAGIRHAAKNPTKYLLKTRFTLTVLGVGSIGWAYAPYKKPAGNKRVPKDPNARTLFEVVRDGENVTGVKMFSFKKAKSNFDRDECDTGIQAEISIGQVI